MKDRKLLRDLKKREPDALDRIMDKYGGYVSMIVFYTMGAGACREDGEEIAADVFLSLWEKAETRGIRRILSYGRRKTMCYFRRCGSSAGRIR